jgi:hypothetical protein
MNGNFESAIGRLGDEWASLPSATVAQPRRSWQFMSAALGGGKFNESKAERSRLAATPKQSPIEALISKRAQQERQALQEIDQDLLQQVSMAPEPPAPIMQQYQPQQIGVQPNPVRDTMLSQLRAEAMQERTKPLRLSIADTWDNTEIKPEEYT